ncbi:dethiobiotin synthetase [Filomicrobium insigne]|uniref:ATP-dependent dethiobiotin synthetase BioD n=1 Tax=Filomicrobium insigne TaxID=418854 RepID=A0A1H0TQ61_9HYPH|nr:dethiobiotin synthetase [Filomicrobium insigne]
MTSGFIVAGTDTGIGKTVFCAALTRALGFNYWKPVQAGTQEETDTQVVQRLSGLPADHFLEPRYSLRTPCSPHLAAEIDKVQIERSQLGLPETVRPFVVELAGGLLVPLTRDLLQIDVIGDWALPIILCARTSLGTINHTLLSIDVLKTRGLNIHGITFIGEENIDTERTICDFAMTRRLGRLPLLASLDAVTLHAAFDAHFRREVFQ